MIRNKQHLSLETTCLGALAYAVLRAQIAAVVAHEDGTRRGEDADELHDMRVATRRLRAALSLFADVVPVEAETLRAELGWLAAGLGVVRDLDVQLEQINQWHAEADQADQSGFQALRTTIEGLRPAARTALLAQLESPRYRRLLAHFQRMLDAGPPPSAAAQRPVLEVAPSLVSKRYKALRKSADLLTPASPPHELHAARIRGKRLRYATEFVAPVYGRPARDFITTLVALQDLLGRHQDAYVAIERLRLLLAEHGEDLPPRALFLMGQVAERYAHEAVQLRAALAGSYAAVRGPAWRAFRHTMKQRRADAVAT